MGWNLFIEPEALGGMESCFFCYFSLFFSPFRRNKIEQDRSHQGIIQAAGPNPYLNAQSYLIRLYIHITFITIYLFFKLIKYNVMEYYRVGIDWLCKRDSVPGWCTCPGRSFCPDGTKPEWCEPEWTRVGTESRTNWCEPPGRDPDGPILARIPPVP